MEGTTLFKHSFVKRKTLSFLCIVCCVTLGKLSICWWQARGNVHGPDPCVHKCTTFTKPIQLFKSEFDVAYYVSTLSTNEKSWHSAAAEGNRKINSEKVSGQSSSIQLLSPYIISSWVSHPSTSFQICTNKSTNSCQNAGGCRYRGQNTEIQIQK